MKKLIWGFICELTLLPFFLYEARRSRSDQRPIDIGLGPMSIVSNLRLKKALQERGYTVETFVKSVFYISSDFDIRLDQEFTAIQHKKRFQLAVFKLLINRYKCLYLFFDGAFVETLFLWRIEPFLWKLAGVKIVASPQGTDLYDLRINKNLLLKNALINDYPKFKLRNAPNRERLKLWSTQADFVIGGCDWIDHMFHWDGLMLNTFCVEKPEASCYRSFNEYIDDKCIIFHAPNHRLTKGTKFLEKAVAELQEEGLRIELDIAEKVSNKEVLHRMQRAHIVADQFVIGWYAIFAIEALSLGKPVLCYLREDLLSFYQNVDLLERGEMPIINTEVNTIKESIKRLYQDPAMCEKISKNGIEFIKRHHSLQAVGLKFEGFNRRIGLPPSGGFTNERSILIDQLQRELFNRSKS